MHHSHLINFESTWEILLEPILVFTLFFVVGVWALLETIIAIRKPITDEQYERWCSNALIHVNFVSSMPYSLENYIMPDTDSYLFIKESVKTWKLFRLNFHNQKKWDSSQWNQHENEIQINEKEELSKALSKLPDKLPEELSADEKYKIIGVLKEKADLGNS